MDVHPALEKQDPTTTEIKLLVYEIFQEKEQHGKKLEQTLQRNATIVKDRQFGASSIALSSFYYSLPVHFSVYDPSR